jgi:thioredoxin-related protein
MVFSFVIKVAFTALHHATIAVRSARVSLAFGKNGFMIMLAPGYLHKNSFMSLF